MDVARSTDGEGGRASQGSHFGMTGGVTGCLSIEFAGRIRRLGVKRRVDENEAIHTTMCHVTTKRQRETMSIETGGIRSARCSFQVLTVHAKQGEGG